MIVSYDFKEQLSRHNAEQTLRDTEVTEVALQKILPIFQEAVPRYLDARKQEGPDHRWNECYVDGEREIGFLLHHGYEDVVFLSSDGELLWSSGGTGNELEPLVKLSLPKTPEQLARLRAVTHTLLNEGNWDEEQERRMHLIEDIRI